MGNAGLDDTQARIRTAGRNTNNLRYADDNNLMAESEEELTLFDTGPHISLRLFISIHYFFSLIFSLSNLH